MIVEMASFEIPEGFGAEELIADARSTVEHWSANKHRIRKHFLRSEDGRVVGLYLWPDRAAARAAHDQEWIARFRKRTGAKPSFAYFDLFMTIDNTAGEVREYPLD